MKVPDDYRAGRNCGVLAVAIVADVSYSKAQLVLSQLRRRKGWKRFTGSTNYADRNEALAMLGVRFETKHLTPTRTLAVFARDWAAPGVVYMLRVYKHVVVLKDGMVVDTWNHTPVPAAAHHCAKQRVTISTRIL